MFRKALSQHAEKDGFRLRGQEIRRIETFSDAVFAFAVTLLIVSLEVPKTFEELLISVRGFYAFGISFFIFIQIWNEQNRFFRRYGLDDSFVKTINIILIFLVLFYVYPLKFLFTLLFSNQIYQVQPNPFQITDAQMPQLMIIYGVGYMSIYLLFFLMYLHAHRNRKSLGLNAREDFQTKTKILSQLTLMLIGLLSVLLALILPLNLTGLSGIIYSIIPFALWILYSVRGKMERKIVIIEDTIPTEKTNDEN